MQINDILDTLSQFMGNRGNNIKKYTRSGKGGKIDDKMFNELMILDPTTLAQIQPFIGGRFVFVPGQMPAMMEVLHPNETNYMRILFSSAVISITGFSERTLEAEEVKAPTDQNTYSVITKQTGATRELTFTFMTMWQSLPCYKYITTWMQYIYNAGSSAATYPHLTGLEYHEGNHSMNGVYLVPDPSFSRVEEGAIIYAMVPLNNSANSIFDQTWGEHGPKEFAVRFKVHVLPGGMPSVIEICQGVLDDFVERVTLHDYNKTVKSPI